MDISGMVVFVGDIESGTSKSGKEWRKIGFTVEYKDGEYNKQAHFTLFGKTVDKCPNDGELVKVSFMPSSREHGGRWYTELSAWEVAVLKEVGKTDDLPF